MGKGNDLGPFQRRGADPVRHGDQDARLLQQAGRAFDQGMGRPMPPVPRHMAKILQ